METVLLVTLAALIVTGCCLTGALFYLDWREDYLSKHKSGRTGV